MSLNSSILEANLILFALAASAFYEKLALKAPFNFYFTGIEEFNKGVLHDLLIIESIDGTYHIISTYAQL